MLIKAANFYATKKAKYFKKKQQKNIQIFGFHEHFFF